MCIKKSELNRSEVLLREWEPKILSWEQSGITQREYCKMEQLKYTRFLFWRMKIRKLKNKDSKKPKHSIVKAGRVDLKQGGIKSNDCHMRLCFDGYILELKDDFSSLSLSRVIKVFKEL